MRSRNLLTALALVLALPLAGCGDDTGGEAGGAEDRSEEVRTVGDAPEVEVTDLGAEPRRSLQIEVEKGQVESTSMTMRQTQTFGGGPPTEVPPMTLSYTTEVLDAGAERVDTEIVYQGASVKKQGADPAMVSQLEAALEPIVGLTMHSAFTTQGANVETTMNLPDDLSPMMDSVFRQFADQASSLMVPWPAEEVGVGASWTATSVLEFNGIEIQQVASYSLDALEGDDYRVSVDLEQTYEPGPAEGFDLESGAGEGHGVIQGSTGYLVPRKSSVTSSNEIVGDAGGETAQIGTKMEMELRSGRP